MTSPPEPFTGANLVAGAHRSDGTDVYRAVAPDRGVEVGPSFPDATPDDIDAATAAAADASEILRHTPGATIAALLEAIADALDGLGDELIEVADTETGLGVPRLVGERARTCGQLRLFAAVVRDGSHLDVRIDHADASLTPPRPDLRRMLVPRGPVAVFGASNFPLAFSVPGGDTASALAAGCPVVVKAHPLHPGTSQRCGQVIADAVAAVGLPAGTFSLLHGRGNAVGRALVLSPPITAVAFTGSLAGGRALFDLGASRAQPIPVYAEMGSLNPVVTTSTALQRRCEEIADGFVASMTLGSGQFCTKPGLVFVPDDDAGRRFEARVAASIASQPAGTMLGGHLRDALGARLATTLEVDGVAVLAEGGPAGPDGVRYAARVLITDLATFRSDPALAEEHFGPVALLVRYPTLSAMTAAAGGLDGTLTATLHAEVEEAAELADLQSVLVQRCGRLLWNQFPTGVAVTHAMHHGGPYPATTDAGHTSVGTAAIARFLRPVCYQNVPPVALPAALHEENPLSLPRLVDSRWTGR